MPQPESPEQPPAPGWQRPRFRETYGAVRPRRLAVHEDERPPSEHLLQCLWYDQLFRTEGLKTLEGQQVEVQAPGWWNRQDGPDFRGAHVSFNGKAFSGDIELHIEPSGWRAHRHDIDPRYNNVILHVTLDSSTQRKPVLTEDGKSIPTLVLRPYVDDSLFALADDLAHDEAQSEAVGPCGKCSELIPEQGVEPLREALELAGEWRMLTKARGMRERMERAGPDQTLYESFMYACGFSAFKHHFRTLARSLPYDRARQLAQQDPLQLEAALMQLAGLLPDSLPEGTTAVPHFARLRAIRRDHFSGLRALPLTWPRNGVRPNNYPERRLAGASRLLARTALDGFSDALIDAWRGSLKPLERRKRFEQLFPSAMGFWADHCTWTGQKLKKRIAPLGCGRIRSIIGNVFVPAGLALARMARDRTMEETVLAFFKSLPKEPDNHILKQMRPRLLAGHKPWRIDFRTQQGLLQFHQDWCEPNPACRNCGMYRYLDRNEPKS